MDAKLFREHVALARRFALRGDMWARCASECEAALALAPEAEEAVEVEEMGGTAYAELVDYEAPLRSLVASESFQRAIQLLDAAAIHDQQKGERYFSRPELRVLTARLDNLHSLASQEVAEREGANAAIRYLVTAISRLPNIPLIECWSELGDLYLQVGEKRYAIDCYKRIVSTPRIHVLEDENEKEIRRHASARLHRLV
jgi:tetratricopeptide (TPR) repeat protein